MAVFIVRYYQYKHITHYYKEVVSKEHKRYVGYEKFVSGVT